MNIRSLLSESVLKASHSLDVSADETLLGLLQVSQSDRPDLSDYQCNAALGLAKRLGVPPREIASLLKAELTKNLDGISEIEVAGPGFINFKLRDAFLAQAAENVLSNPEITTASPKNVIIDFGGPNIAKELHVGHLRPHIIGDSLQRILKAGGDNVQSDIHMGDWGTPIGMIIAQLRSEKPELAFFEESSSHYPKQSPVGIEELSALYKRSKVSWDARDEFKDEARLVTQQLQSGSHPGYHALWKHLRDESLKDVSRIYQRMDVRFDLWLGESDVNDLLPEMVQELQEKGVAIESDGAIVIPFHEDGKPPLILQKSDGGYTYGATDLATIKQRVQDMHADTILYVVDNRQKQHFEQVFSAAHLAGYVDSGIALEHIGHGTINGPDGKPYKTRDGNSIRLKDVLDESCQKALSELPEETVGSSDETPYLASQIGMAAIKFQELKNNRNSDYIFDVAEFTRFDGKTGPYLQYAAVRSKSILDKASELGLTSGGISIQTDSERALALNIARFPEAFEAARNRREPSIIAEHMFNTAQRFGTFYSENKVLNEPNERVRASRLRLVEGANKQISEGLDLLGIECPNQMLRRQREQEVEPERKL